MLTAGVARRVVNPRLHHPHAGWGAQTHIAGTAIEADFWTTVLAIGDEHAAAIMIDFETSHFLAAQADAIRKRIADRLALDVSAIRLSTTHTHSGPMLWSQYYPGYEQVIAEYNEHMVNMTVEAAGEALQNRVAVTVQAGYGTSHVAVNRRQLLGNGRMVTGTNKDGLIDPTVGVIRFDDEHGDIVASIVHYSCHPTTLGFTNTQYSPDYPGVTKRVVEQIVGGKCLFLQGAAGNIGPGPEGFKADIGAMRRIGKSLGCEAAKVLLDIAADGIEHSFEGVVESGAPLGMWKSARKAMAGGSVFKVLSVPIALPLKEQLPIEEAREIAYRYRDELAKLQSRHAPDEQIKEITYKNKRAFFALDRSEQYYGKPSEEITAHLIRLGDTVLIGVPLEPFAQIGIAIRERSPFAHTLFSGYSNGWKGYLPTRDDYPFGGYEVETTPYAPNAAELFIEEIVRVLHEEMQG